MYLIYLLGFVSIVSANIYYDLSNEDYNEVKNSRNFSGKVVLVSGSNSGIGEGIVKLFSVLGAQVVVTGRKAEDVKRVAQEVQQLSPNKLKPLEVVADVTKSEDLSKLLNETIKTFGKLDVLVNNAGIVVTDEIKNKTFIKTFDDVINTDLRALLELTYLSVPYLEKTNGTIISISSGLSRKPSTSFLAYGVAKAGIDFSTKVLALELGPKIRVNSINPGVILTDNFRKSNDSVSKQILTQAEKRSPLKRLGSPSDIARGVAFLASTDAQFITGANLVIDGGLEYT